MSTATSTRYPAEALVAFGQALLRKSGVRDDIASDVATVLVEGDLLGHNTHGLALLPGYLAEIAKGAMATSGAPTIITARAATQAWDGNRLPGPWLTLRALDAAMAMADACGMGSVVIRRSHHIACLAAYLRRVTDQGRMAFIYCSDPSTHSVAPFGGVSSVFTPNPFAAGIPTSGDPILLDISASYTTNGMTARLHKAGEKLAHPWVQDAQGNATTDPGVLFNQPTGTLLPLGGLEGGHKGYALALLVEALTGGLAGFGRADPAEGWGATVYRAGHGPVGVRRRGRLRAADGLAGRRVPRRDAAAWRRTRASAGRERIEAPSRANRQWRRAVPGHHAVAAALGGKIPHTDAPGRADA